jgi:hypothetical protein
LDIKVSLGRLLLKLRLDRDFYDLCLTFNDDHLPLGSLIVIQDLKRYYRAVLF